MLTEAFNVEGYAMYKSGDYILSTAKSTRGGTIYAAYDFLARVLTVQTYKDEGGISVVPFSQLDRESLTFMRDKLIELNGKPPALPKEEEMPTLLSKSKMSPGM